MPEPLSSSAVASSGPPSRLLVPAYGLLAACLSAGYGVLFTVVGDYRDAYGISESTIGWIIGIGFIAGFAAQVFIAPIGDRGYARKVVLAGVGVNIVGLLMMAFGTTAAALMAGRIVSGLAIGSAEPSIRRIVVRSAPDQVGRNLGRLLSAGVFGFAVGPAISAVLVGPFGLAAPFIAIGALSLVGLALTFGVAVPEPVDDEPPRFGLALDLLKNRPLAGATVLGAAVFYMVGSFDALWDVVHEDLGTSVWMANLGITLFAMPMVFLAPIGGRWAQSIGPLAFGAIGLLAAAGFMTSYGLVPSGTWIFGVSLGQAFTDGLTFAAPGIAVAMAAPAHRQASAQGLLGAAQALAAGVAAVTTGLMYQANGRTGAYLASTAVMVAMVGVGMFLAGPSQWTVAKAFKSSPTSGLARPDANAGDDASDGPVTLG